MDRVSRTWETLLTVTKLTDQIRAVVENDRSIFRFKMLPFIALPAAHPWASSPPPGTRITSFTQTSYSVAWAINRALLEASQMARTWAPNGNRWVLGMGETPTYVVSEGDDGSVVRQLQLVENVRIAHPARLSVAEWSADTIGEIGLNPRLAFDDSG